MSAEEAFRRLDTSEQGLTTEEVAARRAQHGFNRLPGVRRKSLAARFMRQFHSLLIYLLLAAALVALLLGHGIDAAVILGVVVLNALIGVIQEGRAERSLEAIHRLVTPVTTVIRDGQRLSIPAEEIVPGDIVRIEAGDQLSGDLRLHRQRGLRVDEALLTGESTTAEKQTSPVAEQLPLGDRSSMAFSGTLVAAGQGEGVVVATGARTELGKVGALLASVEMLKTPLLLQMDRFARHQAVIISAVAVVLLGLLLWTGSYPLAEAVMIVVSLAVAAIPEGLPAVLTITLAIGVQRMAARNAIIRRLPAVETLGAVSVICTDKTGTLTRNEMTVRSLAVSGRDHMVTGAGYAPQGHFEIDGVAVPPEGTVLELVRAGLLCNDALLENRDGEWRVAGDPMEGALVALAMKAGMNAAAERARLPRLDAIPFDAAYRFMATLHRAPTGGAFFAKGAPEQILAMCDAERREEGDVPIDADAWRSRAEAMAAQGQRILGIAVGTLPPQHVDLSFADVERGLTLLGLVGFIDPPREEARAAIASCHDAGIRVIMITGDHAVTAGEIARQLGLADRPQVMTGQELDAIDDAVLRDVVARTDVFARTTPEHKLRLVMALQSAGLTVAMTGDGVNDAPALKRADIGIAMGRKGTEAARQAAAMVLADDNFASIVAAVREGRTIYDNVRKVIACMLPTNGGEAFTIIVALMMGLALPVTPVQILWINMVTAVALDVTLAFEPTEPGTMSRPPRPRGTSLIPGLLLWRVLFVSAVMVSGTFGVFALAQAWGHDLPLARTMAVNMIVVMEIGYLFSVRYRHGTGLSWRGVMGTKAVLIGIAGVTAVQLLFTYAPLMNRLFETRPVPFVEGTVILAVGAAALLLFEAEKAAIRRYFPRAENQALTARAHTSSS